MAAQPVPGLFVLLKLAATWLSAWSGVPGGIFAPSQSIGAGVGHDVAWLPQRPPLSPALIAMGMVAFPSAVAQVPITAFIIVMEMVAGHAMVLSLMAASMLAGLISHPMSRPLYEALAELPLQRLGSDPSPAQPSGPHTDPGVH
jgi:H+/Cl- antiporter ClcA